MLSDVRKIQSINLGDRITVQTIKGIKGNIIGLLPDGRATLFEQNNPYMNMLGPNQRVECNVIHVSPKYVIVDPIREPEPFKKEPYSVEPKLIEYLENQEVYDDPLLEDLRNLSEKGEWKTAIIARALMYIIERFNDLNEKLSEHSSPDKSESIEEQPVEASTTSEELLSAKSSFELTQFNVRESKAPESEFLIYLEGNQRKIEDDNPFSINIENIGSVSDLPKQVRLLTMVQTRYFKEHHLKDIEGYDKIENLSTIYVEASALKRGEYGNVFYASSGTNSWNKVYKITVNRVSD